LEEPYPEVFTFNMNWLNDKVRPTDILKLLISIADTFKIDDMYTCTGKKEARPTY